LTFFTLPVPSWPAELSPKVKLSPVAVTTAEWLFPADPPTTFLERRASTTVGLLRLMVSPRPSCPFCGRGKRERGRRAGRGARGGG
jgi:hypothetical protein